MDGWGAHLMSVWGWPRWHRRPWASPQYLDGGLVDDLVEDWSEYAAVDDAWSQYDSPATARSELASYGPQSWDRSDVLKLYRMGAVELHLADQGRFRTCRFTPEALAHPDVVEALWAG